MNTEFKFDIGRLSIAIAIPSYRGIVPLDLCRNLSFTTGKLVKQGIPYAVITERETPIIPVARNRLVDSFMNQTNFKKLLFVDDDIVFTYEDVERLMCWSTEFPIVCGTYPTRQFPIKFFINFDEQNPELNEYGLLKIRGTGIGFTIIDRSVFEKMDVPEYKTDGKMIKSYFRTEVVDGKMYGEDMLFFQDCIKLGFDVWLDPMIHLQHMGNHMYEGRFDEYLASLLLKEDS